MPATTDRTPTTRATEFNWEATTSDRRRRNRDHDAPPASGSVLGRIVMVVGIVIAVRLFFFAVRVVLTH